MPQSPRYPCYYPACPELTNRKDKYCQHHAPQLREDRREKERLSESFHNKDPRYKDARWINYSRWRKNRYPICEQCKRKATTLTDHIVPIRLGGDFWLESNHQSLCDTCHNIKRAHEQRLHKAQKNRRI